MLKRDVIRDEVHKSIHYYALYLATVTMWVAFMVDYLALGFRWECVAGRFFYLPYILIVLGLWNRFAKLKAFTNFPIIMAVVYITFWLTRWGILSGEFFGEYAVGMDEVLLGMALAPMSRTVYYGLGGGAVITFLVANAIARGGSLAGFSSDLTTLLSVAIFSSIVHEIISKLRVQRWLLQKQLSEQLSHQEEVIRMQSKTLAAAETQVSLGKIARQVSHDIRSPLCALEACLTSPGEITKERVTLAQRALDRIKEIANDLLSQAREASSVLKSSTVGEVSLRELVFLTECLVAEKHIQYPDRILRIDNKLTDDLNVRVQIDQKEMTRILSNLIDNAMEASPASTVCISLVFEAQCVRLQISDTGKGIPAEMISALAQEGVSFGKPNGSGLGLFHARTLVESWNGRFEIQSQVGVGTTVSLDLPTKP